MLTFLKYNLIVIIFITVVRKSFCSSNVEEDFISANNNINCSVDPIIEADLNHFWASTGFCPPDPHNESYIYMLSDDMRQNIVYMGGIPNEGIKQVRVHFLFELLSVIDDNEN